MLTWGGISGTFQRWRGIQRLLSDVKIQSRTDDIITGGACIILCDWKLWVKVTKNICISSWLLLYTPLSINAYPPQSCMVPACRLNRLPLASLLSPLLSFSFPLPNATLTIGHARFLLEHRDDHCHSTVKVCCAVRRQSRTVSSIIPV
jgi:hypothetical protein